MKNFIFTAVFVFLAFVLTLNAQAATLSLSPSSGSYSVGNIFTVTILLNTQSQAVDGVDIRYLNYSQTQLEVQDENTAQVGVQISPGTLLGNTAANNVDTTNGRISFSQVATGGSTYSNTSNATLATVRFKVLTTGIASVTFNFTSGSTADTNVAAGGSDVLTSVTNGSYTLGDTTAPAAVTNLSTSNATLNSVTLSWTAPGDDGSTGTATSYDIRYSTSNITTSNWGSATQVTGEPTPQAAGTVQSMTISGLTSNTTYYFAIRTSDEVPYISGLSNIASVSTQALTLTVALTATPSSGTAPLNDIDLSATISGSASGNINYTFYCNRSDSGTNITTPYDAKYDNQTVTTITAADVCDYLNSGTYTAKVIIERGALAAENRTTVTVSPPITSTKFSSNDRIKAASDINVRSTASVSGTLLGSQVAGARGTVIGGPTYADGYWWWQINYDNDPDGWSFENNMDFPPIVSGVIFTPGLEGVSNISGKSFTITINNVVTSIQQTQFTASGNVSNQVNQPTSVTNFREDRADIYVKSPGYLKAKRADTLITTSATISLPTLKGGDLDDNGIINSLDWSSMNTNWFTADVVSDINKDGIVNSIDFSWMNKNWLQSDAT